MAGPSRTLKLELLAVDRGFRRGFGQAESTVSRFGRAAGTALRGVALGAAAVGGAAIVAGRQFVGSASEMEQAAGAVESVFGDAGGEVERFAQSAAESAGLTITEVRNMSAVLGASLQSYGFEAEAAAGLTVELQERAADMAATFGGETSDAVGAIGALMRGEADPIERFGVSIKQADVNARLAAEGLGELEGEERRLAEAQARLDLLMEQTANSAGQFGREADTLAGRGAVLRAKLSNLGGEIGGPLLDAFSDGTGGLVELVDWLGPKAVAASEWLAAKIGELRQWWDTNGPAITERAREIGQAVMRWWQETAAPAIGRVRDALSRFWHETARPVLDQLKEAWERNRETVGRTFEAVGRILGVFGRVLGDAMGRAEGDVQDATPNIADNITTIVDAIAGVVEGIASFIEWIEPGLRWLGRLSDGFSDLLSPISLVSDALESFRELQDRVSSAASSTSSWWSSVRSRIPGLATGGIVNGPTLAMVGEGDESEVVAPLSRMERWLDRAYSAGSGGGGGGTVINITGTMLDPEGVARAVDDALRRSERRAGAFT